MPRSAVDIRLQRNDRFGLRLREPQSGERGQLEDGDGQMFDVVAADVDDAQARQLSDLRREAFQLVLAHREHRQSVARAQLARKMFQEVFVEHQRVQFAQQSH